MKPTIAALPASPAAVHFVGIGGIGMSGLARILHAWGYDVSGSDSVQSDQVDLLNAEGIPVVVGHTLTDRAARADLVVATAAVGTGNPELDAAASAGVPIVKRAELLGLLANSRTCIAVAGSHGKSTTSGMLVSALRALGSNPAYAVGAIVGTTGTNAAPGTSDEMVVEADEYDHSFVWLKPAFGIVTNIDYDHPDLFPDQATYDRAFQDFVAGFAPGSLLAVNGDDPGVLRSLDRFRALPARIVTYGRSPNVDWRIDGRTVHAPDGQTVQLELQVPGDHNISNATATMIVLTGLSHALADAARAVGTFAGVGRRFEAKGDAAGVTVIDDYAHHPEEIRVTIAAARERFPGRRLIVAFQPHTYSRTKALLDEFASALSGADLPVVLDIYRARETDTLGVSSDDIRAQMSGTPLAGGEPEAAVELLATLARTGDVVITMGAGTVTSVGPALLARLNGGGA